MAALFVPRKGINLQSILIYTTGPTCQACRNTKRWLSNRGIPFTEIDVTSSPDDAATARALGYTQSPVVVVTEADGAVSHFSGFDPTQLVRLAGAVAA